MGVAHNNNSTLDVNQGDRVGSVPSDLNHQFAPQRCSEKPVVTTTPNLAKNSASPSL